MANTANVTLNRRTTLVIEPDTYGIKCPGLALQREHQEIGRGGSQNLTNVTFHPGIGWRLRAYQDESEFGYENSAVPDSAYLDPTSNASGADRLVSKSVNRQNSDITAMAGGYAGTYPATSGKLWQIDYAASDTTPSVLTSDQTAWPSPDTANDRVTMDRILVGNNPHAPGDSISVTYQNPSSYPSSTLLNVHFSGPAGVHDDGYVGKGEYCLKVSGSGNAYLFEHVYALPGDTSYVWRLVYQYKWDTTKVHKGGTICIVSNARLVSSGWKGDNISFYHVSIGEGFTVVEVLNAAARKAIYGRVPTGQYVIKKTKGQLPTTTRPLRLDVRRDVRLRVALQMHRYKTPGTIQDDPLGLGFIPSAGQEVEVNVHGRIETGSTCTIALYNADTNIAIAASSTETIPGPTGGKSGVRAFFPLTSAVKRIYAKLTLTSTDGTVTCTIKSIRYIVDSTSIKRTRTAQNANIQHFSFKGPTDDPTTEGGTFDLHDVPGTFDTPLALRAGMPCLLKTTYDSGGTAISILARGYLEPSYRQVGGDRGRGSTPRWGDSRWKDYKLTFSPEVSRLDKALTPKSFNYAIDPTATGADGEPVAFRVSNVISILLADAGYPESMVDVPVYPLRFFGASSETLYLEYRTPILDKITNFTRDYLGMYLVFDPNAGAGGTGTALTDLDGMWRLRQYPQSKNNAGTYHFRSVAHFYKDIPTHSGTKLVHHQGSYPDIANAWSDTIKTTFIRKGTLTEGQIKPACNVIEVWGVQPVAGLLTSTNSALKKLTGVAYNFKSAYFFDGQEALASGTMAPDPTSIDYLGFEVRVVFLDPGLTTPEAVNFVTRRLYNFLCHGRKTKRFQAPLILITDSQDTKQIRPRPLRFGDIVTVEGETSTYYMVRSVTIDYKQDGTQFAWYEIETPAPKESLAYTT